MEKISTKDFILRTAAVSLAGIIIIVLVHFLIIKPLTTKKARVVIADKPSYTAKGQCNPAKSKEKIKIDWKEAEKYIDRYVITEGIILSAYNSGKVCFLNFHKDYRNHLSLVIFSSCYKKFPDNPEKYYRGRLVRAEGRIKEYKGRLEIVLNTPEQIKVIE